MRLLLLCVVVASASAEGATARTREFAHLNAVAQMILADDDDALGLRDAQHADIRRKRPRHVLKVAARQKRRGAPDATPPRRRQRPRRRSQATDHEHQAQHALAKNPKS